MLDVSAHPMDLSDWMSGLPDQVPISTVSLPGTHNSSSFAIGPPRMAAIVAAGRCQVRDLSSQLAMGVRFLDLRVKPCGALCHGYISCGNLGLRDALSVCSAFLCLHPREVIIARIKDEACSKASASAIASLVRSLSDVCPLFTEPCLPSLGEVRGQVVILRDWSESRPVIQGRSCVLARKASRFGLLWAGRSMQIQDEYSQRNGAEKWRIVQAQLCQTRASNSCLNINFTSATSLPSKTPVSIARCVNPKLAAHLRASVPRFVGIIVMDFPSAALCGLIVRQNQCRLDPCRPLPAHSITMASSRSTNSLQLFTNLQSELIAGALRADHALEALQNSQADTVELEKAMKGEARWLSRVLVRLSTERAKVTINEPSVEDVSWLANSKVAPLPPSPKSTRSSLMAHAWSATVTNITQSSPLSSNAGECSPAPCRSRRRKSSFLGRFACM